jgi:hypothetical protein
MPSSYVPLVVWGGGLVWSVCSVKAGYSKQPPWPLNGAMAHVARVLAGHLKGAGRVT